MSAAPTFVIPDIRSLTRLVTKKYPTYEVPRVYGMVFEFVRFFRLKQKLNDVNPREAVLAPSYAVDQVWHLFLQDTVQYQQACGGNFVHHDPSGLPDGTYQARLKRTREEYEAEYHEAPPAEFWQDDEVLVPSSPPLTRAVRKRSREPAVFNIWVRQPSGRPTLIEKIPVNTPVAGFRAKVSSSIGIPPEEIRLITQGRSLDDGDLLSDYSGLDVEMDNIVDVVRRLRGC